MARIGKIYERGKNYYIAFIIVQRREDEARFHIVSVDINKVGRIK